MARTAENILEELYLANLELIGEGFPAAFNRGRRAVAEAMHLGGVLPGAGDERYHLTDVRALYEGPWEYYFTPPAEPVNEVCGCESDSYQGLKITLNNGFTDGDLRRDEATGVVYGSLCAACAEEWDTVGQYYNSAIRAGQPDPLADINGAFIQDGAYVYVPEGISLEEPVVVDCRYGGRGDDAACFVRTLVILAPRAKAEIVIIHRSGRERAFLVNSIAEIVATEGARAHISGFSCMNAESTLLHGNHIEQSAASDVQTVWTSLGGRTTRTAHHMGLSGREAHGRLDALYLAPQDEVMAFDVRAEHRAPGCRSYELVKGVAAGTARGSFTGMAYVAPGAQQTEAMQQSRNLELSPTAKIYARPRLEIYADDVKCSHGATVGQLDAEAVYYMRQRGISLADARRLQLEGFIRDITDRYGRGAQMVEGLVQRYMDKL